MGSIKLNLSRHDGGLIHVMTAPPSTLRDLQVVERKLSKTELSVKLSGVVEGLVSDTPCDVEWNIKPTGGELRVESAERVKLEVSGTKCTLESKIDVIEAGLTGAGTFSITVKPKFVGLDETAKTQDYAYDYACNVELGNYAKSMKIGRLVTLTPKVDAKLDCSLRVRFVERDESNKKSDTVEYEEVDDSTKGFRTVFEWGDDKSAKTWRVGCSESEGPPVLDYLEAWEEGEFELVIFVEASRDGKRFHRLKTLQAKVAKPRLKTFETGWRAVELFGQMTEAPPPLEQILYAYGQLENLEPGFELPIEVSLWGHKAVSAAHPNVHVMTKFDRSPKRAEVGAKGHFAVRLLRRRMEMSDEVHGYVPFSVLRIPPAVAGRPPGDYVPVVRALGYGEAHRAIGSVDFPELDPVPHSKKLPRKLRGQDLGTGVCSTLGKFEMTKLPHFGAVSFSVRGSSLVISTRVSGDIEYWGDAKPQVKIQVKDVWVETLAAKPSKADPRHYEASIAMGKDTIVGKSIIARYEASNTKAKLAGEVPTSPPPPTSDSFECRPAWLGRSISWSLEDNDGKRTGRIRVPTHFYPTGQSGVHLRILDAAGNELKAGTKPIALRFDQPVNGAKDGLVDPATGCVGASITKNAHLDAIVAAKTIMIEVSRRYPKAAPGITLGTTKIAMPAVKSPAIRVDGGGSR